MTLADRVARRFIARAAPRLEFFADEQETALGTLSGLHAYGKTLLKARDLLRPVAECLRSKALGKIFINLTSGADAIPVLQRELEGIVADMQKVDREMFAEAQRHADILRDGPDDLEIDMNDVRLPTTALKALQARVNRYHASVEKTFENLSVSLEDVGTAGSMDLRAYERLIEKLPGWEDLNISELELDGLDDAVAMRALDAL